MDTELLEFSLAFRGLSDDPDGESEDLTLKDDDDEEEDDDDLEAGKGDGEDAKDGDELTVEE